MSEDAAQAIEAYYAKRDNDRRRHDFIERMEHKLYAKERHQDRHNR